MTEFNYIFKSFFVSLCVVLVTFSLFKVSSPMVIIGLGVILLLIGLGNLFSVKKQA